MERERGLIINIDYLVITEKIFLYRVISSTPFVISRFTRKYLIYEWMEDSWWNVINSSSRHIYEDEVDTLNESQKKLYSVRLTKLYKSVIWIP